MPHPIRNIERQSTLILESTAEDFRAPARIGPLANRAKGRAPSSLKPKKFAHVRTGTL